jgi:hypothetical protein
MSSNDERRSGWLDDLEDTSVTIPEVGATFTEPDGRVWTWDGLNWGTPAPGRTA